MGPLTPERNYTVWKHQHRKIVNIIVSTSILAQHYKDNKYTTCITCSLSYCLGDQHLIGSNKDNVVFLLSHSKEADLEELEIIYI